MENECSNRWWKTRMSCHIDLYFIWKAQSFGRRGTDNLPQNFSRGWYKNSFVFKISQAGTQKELAGYVLDTRSPILRTCLSLFPFSLPFLPSFPPFFPPSLLPSLPLLPSCSPFFPPSLLSFFCERSKIMTINIMELSLWWIKKARGKDWETTTKLQNIEDILNMGEIKRFRTKMEETTCWIEIGKSEGGAD